MFCTLLCTLTVHTQSFVTWLGNFHFINHIKISFVVTNQNQPPQLWHLAVWTRQVASPQLWQCVAYNNNFDILTICNCAVTGTGNSNKSANWERAAVCENYSLLISTRTWTMIIDLSNYCFYLCCMGWVLLIILSIAWDGCIIVLR